MMVNEGSEARAEFEPDMRHYVHAAIRLILAVRYWKNLVAVIMTACALLGILYYATAQRQYSTKASLLITKSGGEQLKTSITNDSQSSQEDMYTFEKIIPSAKVLEEAVKKLPPEDRIDFPNASCEAMVGGLKTRLSTKLLRNTNILDVSYVSSDPQVAANVVRTVVQSYLEFIDVIQKGTAGEISKVLTRERNEIIEKLNAKQEELLEARKNLADLGFRSESKTLHPLVQRAVFFNDTLIGVQKQRVEYEAALASLQAVLDNGGDVAQCIGTISEVLGKEIIMENLGLGSQNVNSRMNMEQELVQAKSELQSLERNLGAQHPDVVALNGKIAMIENFLESSRLGSGNFQTDYLQNYFAPWLEKMLQSKLEESRKKEEIFAKRFEAAREEAVNLNGQMVRVELLERDVKRLADMSDVLLNQLASLNMKQNGQDVRVTVIEEPTVNEAPISPQLRFVVPFTLVAGMIASLLAVSILDALNDRFRSMDELQTRLKVTVLGIIRHLKPPATKGLQSIAMHATPGAVECEGFRTLRTALGMTHQDARQILISSAESGDGKTTTLANLSVCYAQSDKRVLLIDADLRRMGLTQLLNMQGVSGLSEVLRREEEIETLAPKHVRASGVRGLDVLPAGPRSSNPSELLASPRFSQMLSWAGTKYDYIFIDCTPALITTDPAIIAQVVDGVVFVVQPAKNRRQLISHMVERFGLLNINVLGVIVNATGTEEETYGYNGLYGDYGHYGTYGVYGENESAMEEDAGEDVHLPRTPTVVAAEDDDELVQPTIVPRRISKAG